MQSEARDEGPDTFRALSPVRPLASRPLSPSRPFALPASLALSPVRPLALTIPATSFRASLRALIKPAPGPGMVVRDVPVPSCGPSDVLIRVHHAGVCGTDLHIWEWDSWASNRLRPPVVIGHEFAGEIVQLGREAEAAGLLTVGEAVTAEGHI